MVALVAILVLLSPALAAPFQQLPFSLRPPLTKQPATCPGYHVVDSNHTARGHRFRLELSGSPCNAFGLDDKHLLVEVEQQTESRLRVHIYDEDGSNVLVPESVLPLPSLARDIGPASLAFDYQEAPFAFWVTRKADGEVLFDTRSKQLIFEDQYIQLGSELPVNANIYGLGEVAASSGFRRDPNSTRQALYNHDAPTPVDANLYGSHAVYLEHRGAKAHAVYLRNSHAMDVFLRSGEIQYSAIGGTFDLYFLDGPSPLEAIRNYVSLVGLPQMQPRWALGFHLSRWGYTTVNETREAVRRMKEAEIPLDVQWNDIDYMRDYEDFTIDEERFPAKEMAAFVDELHDNGQYYVPIVDLGIAISDNPAYNSGIEEDVFLRNHDGSLYSGLVWPGYTTYPDFFANGTQKWWHAGFKNLSELVDFDGIWLDMNEASNFCDGGCARDDWPPYKGTAESEGLDSPPYWPGVYGGGGLPQHAIRPSAKHANGLLEYNVHNLFGLMECQATNKALRQMRPNKRPFLLTRSTFPGSGTVASHWLGDNFSTWASFRLSIQGLLQFGIYGVPMIGPDVGGFIGDTTEELMGRWIQFGALAYPFFRVHNDRTAISQEPYIWDSVAAISRDAIKLRYALMPYIYTLLHEASADGTPIVRALSWEFSDEPELLSNDRQVMLGPSLLISPVLEEGAKTLDVYLPGNETWRALLGQFAEEAPGWHRGYDAPFGVLPVHLRAGSIILMHSEPGMTLRDTERDSPYSLIVNLDSQQRASGKAYFDDGISLEGDSRSVHFEVADNCLVWASKGNYTVAHPIERIMLLGRRASADEEAVFADPTYSLNESFKRCW